MRLAEIWRWTSYRTKTGRQLRNYRTYEDNDISIFVADYKKATRHLTFHTRTDAQVYGIEARIPLGRFLKSLGITAEDCAEALEAIQGES